MVQVMPSSPDRNLKTPDILTFYIHKIIKRSKSGFIGKLMIFLASGDQNTSRKVVKKNIPNFENYFKNRVSGNSNKKNCPRDTAGVPADYETRGQ